MRRRIRGGWVVAASALSIATTVAATWPLVWYADRSIVTPTPRCAGGCADAKAALWTVTEGGRRLFADPRTVYEARIFYPLRHALTFSESGLSLGALAAPVNALTANPLVGFNATYLASWVLTGIGVFLVVRRLTGAPAAALLALILAVLAPERLAARPDLFALATPWLPFVLHGTLLSLDRPSVLRALWLAAAVVLFCHSRAVHVPALPILLAPWLFGLWFARQGSWRAWGVTLAALAVGAALSVASHAPRYEAYEELTSVALAPSAGARWGRGMLADLAGAMEGRGLPYLLAPWHALAAVLVGLAALGGGRTIWALGAALVPAAVLAFLSLRTQASVFVAIAVGVAFAALLARRGRTLGMFAAAAVALVAVGGVPLSGRRAPLTPMPEVVDPPRIYRWLARTPPETRIFELPTGDPDTDATYMVHALSHRRSLVNGYAARVPEVPMVSSFPALGAILALADADVDLVLLHEDRLANRARTLRRLAARDDLEHERIGRTRIVHIPALPPPPAWRDPAIPRQAWRVTTGQEAVADGDLATHWLVSSPGPEDAIEIEFEGVWVISGISIELGPHVRGYPGEWVVRASLSSDRRKWRRLGGGTNVGPPLRSYRADHRHVAMPLEVRPAAARMLRISPEWSAGLVDIHEITLHGTQVGGPPPRETNR